MGPTSRAKKGAAKPAPAESRQRLKAAGVPPENASAQVIEAAASIASKAAVPETQLPEDVRATNRALERQAHRFHGAKINLAWFPWRHLASPCADKFGYLTSKLLRIATRLPFNASTMVLMDKLGELMGNPGRETAPDSPIPAGFTYVGQFVDHDITLDVSSALDVATDAEHVNNMRTPALDLDSRLRRAGRRWTRSCTRSRRRGPPTAIKLQLGTNTQHRPGRPGGSAAATSGMRCRPTSTCLASTTR